MKKLLFFTLIIALALGASCAPPPEQIENTVANTEAWTEINRTMYLESLYLYEGLRATSSVADGAEQGVLTDEQIQILQAADERYSKLNDDLFMPIGDEISYEEAKQIMPQMAITLELSDRVPDLCFYYFLEYSQANYDARRGAEWGAALIYEDGYHYRLIISADDGSLVRWARHPNGYFTDIQPDPSRMYGFMTDQDKARITAKQDVVFETAKDYAVRVFGGEDPFCNWGKLSSISPGCEAGLPVEVKLTGNSYIIMVAEDLSIVAVERL